MRNSYLYITLLAVLGFNAEAFGQSLQSPPRLVVSIAIDQLRSDYMESNFPLYGEAGLKRLLNNGLVFTHASYPFVPIDHASATATIATGTTPYYHGIPSSEWLNRNTLRPISCTDDDKYKASPARLESSTIGDELKISTQGLARVFAFAPNASTAILSAGHAADGVAWIENAKWNISSYYTNEWLDSYVRFYAPETDYNKSITQIVLNCIEQASVGTDETTDFISIEYTPCKQASYKQDAACQIDGYLSIDREIATLTEAIEQKVGKEGVLFVLTGTGYFKEEERKEEESKYRIPTGKLNITRTSDLLNLYFGAVYGNGRYIEAHYKNHIFLNQKLFEQKNIRKEEALRRAQEFLLQIEGIRNVYTSSQLLTSDNLQWEKIRNGFCIDKCGDLLIDVAPGWQLIDENIQQAPTHRVGNIIFPIIFYGSNIKARKIDTPVTVDRIAPTLAKSIRIRAPNACSATPLF